MSRPRQSRTNPEALRELRERLKATQDAAQRLAEEASGAERERPPPNGWDVPRRAEDANAELEAIVRMLAALRDVLPQDDRWRHRHGSHGHGRDHVLPALVAPFATVPVLGGELALGTWQSVALVDTNVDNPDRSVWLSFLAG